MLYRHIYSYRQCFSGSKAIIMYNLRRRDTARADAAASATSRTTLYAYARDRLRLKVARVKKVQFTAILFLCMGILVFQCAQCVRKLLAFKTGTADKYSHVSSAAFPDLTLCPPYPYRDDRLEYHGVSK